MKTLQQCDWRAYRMNEIFIIQTGANVSKSHLNEGRIPRITATDVNNGVDLFSNNSENKNFRTYENCVSISFLGSCFYQPYKASYDMKIHNITLRDRPFNKYIALFVANQCKRTCSQVTYGNQMSSTDLQNQFIYLPSTPNGEPDYAFMEEYMRHKEKMLLNKYKNHISYLLDNQQVIEMGGGKPICTNWKEFRIEDIFSIDSGVRLTAANMKSGKRPFIGATDSNNGITAFVGNTNKSMDRNVLGVNYNGSVVENFYHPYEAVFSDDVKRLHLKEEQGNRFIYLFIKQCILMQKTKYQYGYKFNGERMKKQFIMLPCTPEDTPDWQYMESYMRNVESQQILKYLEHLNACI